MKLFKNLAAALLLASVLSINVSAGDQHSPGNPTPPPPATAPEDGTDKTATTETQEPAPAEELWVDVLTTLLSFY